LPRNRHSAPSPTTARPGHTTPRRTAVARQLRSENASPSPPLPRPEAGCLATGIPRHHPPRAAPPGTPPSQRPSHGHAARSSTPRRARSCEATALREYNGAPETQRRSADATPHSLLRCNPEAGCLATGIPRHHPLPRRPAWHATIPAAVARPRSPIQHATSCPQLRGNGAPETQRRSGNAPPHSLPRSRPEAGCLATGIPRRLPRRPDPAAPLRAGPQLQGTSAPGRHRAGAE
jgi:hypothetical protein